MRSVLRLTVFEEFELWLQSLQVYCREAGKQLGSSEIDAEMNCRSQIKAVVDVMGELIQRCPKIVEPELGKVDPLTLANGEQETKEEPALIARFSDFFQLWEFLQRCRVVGASMGRNATLSLKEYKAFGSLIANQIAIYSRGEAHQMLTRKYLVFKYQHLIERDLVCSIEADGAREELSQIFLDFLRLLSYLDYFQNSIRHSFKFHRLFILLHYFRSRYNALLKLLEQSHQYLGYSLPQLNQEVTSVRFALKMEVKRIFRSELKGVESQQKLGEIYSRIETALGLLTHITQHSFVGLVQQLNPSFNEKTLFSDARDQQAEAMRLVTDLNQLYKLAVEAGKDHSPATYQQVLTGMDRFQSGSMRLLFFKDWGPVESFAQELQEARGDQRAFVLHRLEVFLSALIGEVSKRAVLGTVNRAVGS